MKTDIGITAKSVSSPRGLTIAFWIITSLLALVLISGGLAQLLHRPENVEGMRHLGYPLYMCTILGFWKILGGIAILVPGFPRVKEWAYAGIFFELTGASASQAACGDSFAHILWPLFFAALAVLSWRIRPASHK